MPARTSGASSPSTEAGRLVLDPGVHVLDGGRKLLGGEPYRLLTLSDAGAEALGELLEDPRGRSAEVRALAARLVAAGMLHPVPPPAAALPDTTTVTVVIPVRDPPVSLGALAASLTGAGVPVSLVDDGSADGGAATERIATAAGASLVRRAESGGPSAARNTARPTTVLTAYLDADTVLSDPLGWLARCAEHFSDDRVALVAPRIRSSPPTEGDAVSNYEALESPLDLGERPGLVGPGRRLSYVPAAALVARTEALSGLGGFDESLRYGEDVDLVRRLTAAGWLVRYEPEAVVEHLPRSGLAAFCRQRFGYGTAAAAIERRHPGTVAPFVATPVVGLSLALAGAAAALRGPRRLRVALATGALGVDLAGAVRLQRRLAEHRCPDAGALALRLTARASVGAAAGALSATRHAWWPLLAAGLLTRRTRRRTAALLAVASLAGHLRPALRSGAAARHLGIGVADDVAYGAGVLAGCARERSLRALAPRLVRPGSARR